MKCLNTIEKAEIYDTYEPRHEKIKVQTVQLQKMVRGLKFRIQKVEGLYYLCNENKGADQLRGYHELLPRS